MVKKLPAPKTGGKKKSAPDAAAKKKTLAVSGKKPAAVRKAPVKKTLAPARKAAETKKSTAVTSRKNPVKKSPVKKKSKDMTRYRCRICGYVYSPLRGEPHNGIPAGTAFDDLPEDYVCPVCGMQGKGRIGKWGFDEWRPTRYICSMCNYIYDEKRGEPHRGIKPGTKFEDLPDDYVCPVCALDPKIRIQFGKVRKQGFEPLPL
jgi:rubredoxin